MTTPKDIANPITQISSTVDWLTVTAKSQSRRNEIVDKLFHVKQFLARSGEKERQWRFRDYVGYRIGNLFWARREADDIASVSGELADENYLWLIGLATGVTRVDLAVTVKFRYDDIGLAQRHFGLMQDLALDLPIFRKYSLITNLLGGDTLYVGAASSDERGRVYDKMRQQNYTEFLHSWRYEVQFRRRPAMQVVAEIVAAQSPDQYILAKVGAWFEKRLIHVPFEPYGTYDAIPIQRRKTTDDRALAWLEKTVRPTVARLLARREEKEVLAALGIDLSKLEGV